MNAESIVSKVWSFCTTLRDDGVGYGDYLEQLTYLIFLKMADEYSKPPYNRDVGIPDEYNWHSLRSKKGAELEVHYVSLLRALADNKGMLGHIFTKSQNKIQDPSGAGQYFTPRALIKTMVTCMRPQPLQTIADPACGTGGFFLSAYDYLVENHKLDKGQKAFLKHDTFHGNEIVANTRRLCLMNMFLHNIGEIDGNSAVSSNDALIAPPDQTVDMVLANPPFGKKSSMTFTNEEGEQEKDELTYNRQDFWATTSNKQVNFVQHIRSLLKSTGRAAVVVPDNVLFEGGAGEIVRKKLMETTDLHTILRLPTGIFYANGVKANVLFFDNHPAAKEPWTKEIWFYDYRTNVHHTLKKKPLRVEHLDDFIQCFAAENRFVRKETWSDQSNPDGRWRKFSYEQIIARDKTSLDIFWLKDKSLTDLDHLPEPEVLAAEIIENMESGLNSFKAVLAELSS
ncbi:MAG: DNA methyltransferase [Desulfobacteraceae bacterium 4572_35.1]|nr:MAG: DNA methyltransferase [Desulfobacteraceae bacterium 4572_35.1]